MINVEYAQFDGRLMTPGRSRFLRHRCDFTLVELFAVNNIIALLVAIVLPALAWARKSVQRVQRISQTSQIFLYGSCYALDFKNAYPVQPYWLKWSNGKDSDDDYHPTIARMAGMVNGWYQVRILDHIDDKLRVRSSAREQYHEHRDQH